MEDCTYDGWQTWRMCKRKRRFREQKHARRTARKRNMRIYECPICDNWHLTKRPMEF